MKRIISVALCMLMVLGTIVPSLAVGGVERSLSVVGPETISTGDDSVQIDIVLSDNDAVGVWGATIAVAYTKGWTVETIDNGELWDNGEFSYNAAPTPGTYENFNIDSSRYDVALIHVEKNDTDINVTENGVLAKLVLGAPASFAEGTKLEVKLAYDEDDPIAVGNGGDDVIDVRFLITDYSAPVVTAGAVIAAISNVSAKPGETVTVDVSFKYPAEVKSLAVSDLEYDKTKLSLVDAHWNVEEAMLAVWDATENIGAVACASNIIISGSVFTFTFKVLDGAEEGRADISCTVTARSKPEGIEVFVPVVTLSGSVAVTGCAHEYFYEKCVKDATCTEEGITELICARCGDVVEVIHELALGHSFGAAQVVKDPTCVEAGSRRARCTSCGETVEYEIAALGHDIVNLYKPATCTEDGYSVDSCARCNVIFDATATVIKSTGHSETEIEYSPATCYDDGYIVYGCSVCGELLRTDRLPASHSYTDTVYQASPYALEGYTVHTCDVCGDTYTDGYTTYIEDGAAKAVLSCPKGKSGDVVAVTVDFMNCPEVKTLGIKDVVYDHSKLELVGGEWNVNGVIKDWNNDKETGVIAFTTNQQFDGSVFTFYFRIRDGIDDCETPVSFTLTARGRDNAGHEGTVDITAYGGRIIVNNIIRGDVNGDGEVNSNDAIDLLNYLLLGGDEYGYYINQNGDMNGDGMEDSDDAIHLLYYVLFPDEYTLADR